MRTPIFATADKEDVALLKDAANRLDLDFIDYIQLVLTEAAGQEYARQQESTHKTQDENA